MILLRCFLPRVGFGAGFSKMHTGQVACFDDKNS